MGGRTHDSRGMDPSALQSLISTQETGRACECQFGMRTYQQWLLACGAGRKLTGDHRARSGFQRLLEILWVFYKDDLIRRRNIDAAHGVYFRFPVPDQAGSDSLCQLSEG